MEEAQTILNFMEYRKSLIEAKERRLAELQQMALKTSLWMDDFVSQVRNKIQTGEDIEYTQIDFSEFNSEEPTPTWVNNAEVPPLMDKVKRKPKKPSKQKFAIKRRLYSSFNNDDMQNHKKVKALCYNITTKPETLLDDEMRMVEDYEEMESNGHNVNNIIEEEPSKEDLDRTEVEKGQLSSMGRNLDTNPNEMVLNSLEVENKLSMAVSNINLANDVNNTNDLLTDSNINLIMNYKDQTEISTIANNNKDLTIHHVESQQTGNEQLPKFCFTNPLDSQKNNYSNNVIDILTKSDLEAIVKLGDHSNCQISSQIKQELTQKLMEEMNKNTLKESEIKKHNETEKLSSGIAWSNIFDSIQADKTSMNVNILPPDSQTVVKEHPKDNIDIIDPAFMSKKPKELINPMENTHSDFTFQKPQVTNKEKLFNILFDTSQDDNSFYKPSESPMVEKWQPLPKQDDKKATSKTIQVIKPFKEPSNNTNNANNFNNFNNNFNNIQPNFKNLNSKSNLPFTKGYEISDHSNSDDDDDYDSEFENLFNQTPGFNFPRKAKKEIPAWANDNNYILERVKYQQKFLNPKTIFGEFKVENLDLNMIFSTEKSKYYRRGESADWRLDNTLVSNKKGFEGATEGVGKDPSRQLLKDFNMN
jgi:hypothetical protein